MTSIEKLDLLLQFFIESPHSKPHINDENILKYLEKGIVQDAAELLKLLNKLIKDEYLVVELRQINGGSYPLKHYSLTFEGDYFIRYDGGYLGKIRKEAENTKQLDQFRSTQSDQAAKLNKLTSWIAWGTIIAAFYYSIELIKTILSICNLVKK